MARLRTHNNRAKRALLKALNRQQVAAAAAETMEPIASLAVTATVPSPKRALLPERRELVKATHTIKSNPDSVIPLHNLINPKSDYGTSSLEKNEARKYHTS